MGDGGVIPGAARLYCLREALRGKSLGIDGGIGAGKSTLCLALDRVVRNIVGLPVVHLAENMRPKLFSYFENDVKANAFPTQMTMLGKRLVAIDTMKHVKETGKFGLMDRTIRGDYAFMLMHHKDGNINDRQREIYEEESYGTCQETPLEEMTILRLQTTDEVQKTRIVHRSRPKEVKFYLETDPTYLQRLEVAHDESMENPHLAPARVMHLNWDENKVLDDEACLRLLESIFLASP
jgi:deoxyadenosine/deoxycytidine kinase